MMVDPFDLSGYNFVLLTCKVEEMVGMNVLPSSAMAKMKRWIA